MRKGKIDRLLLLIALVCFGFDLLHFASHLRHDPTLLGLSGVPLALAWKGGLFLGVLALSIFSRKMFVFVFGLLLTFSQGGTQNLGAAGKGVCERAREFMEESGIARDAKENFLGRVKITPPRSSFPPEMDKITWWGTIKPFEFWERPPLEATWINPAQEPVHRIPFRGGACKLAKATLKVSGLPQGRLEPGVWRVVVSCEEEVIDNHPFAVIAPPSSPQDRGRGKDSGVMIWAEDVR